MRVPRYRARRFAATCAVSGGARSRSGSTTNNTMKIVERTFAEADRRALLEAGLHPLLARLYAARRIRSADELEYGPTRLLALAPMKGLEAAARLLADAIAAQKRLLIIADYDADGATACAVGLRALRSFGARVDYLVPDRFKLGYGLSPELVELAAASSAGKPDLIITVDNGIASVEGVARAHALGIATLITDHHLPGAELPQAECIVNPNQPGCQFPSKALAGVGVMFYVVLALRAELRRRGRFSEEKEFNLGSLTDLLAPGTVADVVPLDANNRNLVSQGLKRLRAGRGQPGVMALLRAAGRSPARATSFHLRFVAGPPLHPPGRRAPAPAAQLRPGFRRRAPPQRRGPARRHERRHRMPDCRRRSPGHEPRAGARSAQYRAQGDRDIDAAPGLRTSESGQGHRLDLLRCRLAPRRSRHPRRAAQGPRAPPGDLLRAGARRRQAGAARLRALDSGPPSQGLPRSRREACPGPHRALRRACHGCRVDDRRTGL